MKIKMSNSISMMLTVHWLPSPPLSVMTHQYRVLIVWKRNKIKKGREKKRREEKIKEEKRKEEKRKEEKKRVKRRNIEKKIKEKKSEIIENNNENN